MLLGWGLAGDIDSPGIRVLSPVPLSSPEEILSPVPLSSPEEIRSPCRVQHRSPVKGIYVRDEPGLVSGEHCERSKTGAAKACDSGPNRARSGDLEQLAEPAAVHMANQLTDARSRPLTVVTRSSPPVFDHWQSTS